jgi:hypothetical protein
MPTSATYSIQAACVLRAHEASPLTLSQLLHMTWSHTGKVLEELARRGLTTLSAIEEACQTDYALLWRLVSSFARVRLLKDALFVTLEDAIWAYPRSHRMWLSRWEFLERYVLQKTNV